MKRRSKVRNEERKQKYKQKWSIKVEKLQSKKKWTEKGRHVVEVKK